MNRVLILTHLIPSSVGPPSPHVLIPLVLESREAQTISAGGGSLAGRGRAVVTEMAEWNPPELLLSPHPHTQNKKPKGILWTRSVVNSVSHVLPDVRGLHQSKSTCSQHPANPFSPNPLFIKHKQMGSLFPLSSDNSTPAPSSPGPLTLQPCVMTLHSGTWGLCHSTGQHTDSWY